MKIKIESVLKPIFHCPNCRRPIQFKMFGKIKMGPGATINLNCGNCKKEKIVEGKKEEVYFGSIQIKIKKEPEGDGK